MYNMYAGDVDRQSFPLNVNGQGDARRAAGRTMALGSIDNSNILLFAHVFTASTAFVAYSIDGKPEVTEQGIGIFQQRIIGPHRPSRLKHPLAVA